MNYRERREIGEKQLLLNMKAALPKMEALLAEVDDRWVVEDLMYRLYHHSFKVYYAQGWTEKIIWQLLELHPFPGDPLNEDFTKVIGSGTGKHFTMDVNQRWLSETRPIIEALLHARLFLLMAIKYAKELEEPVQFLPSGWAMFLYLYGLR